MNVQKQKILVYQGYAGSIELYGDVDQETVWANQAQISLLFGINQSVVSRHIKNIFSAGEVDEKSNMQKMHITKSDKPVVFYSLDVILSIGYRANSGEAINFRKWATSKIKSFLIDGYVINKNRISGNYHVFLQAIKDLRKLLENANKNIHQSLLQDIPQPLQDLLNKGKKAGRVSQDELTALLPRAEEDVDLLDRVYNVLLVNEIELVDNLFTDTWTLLEAYDRGALQTHNAHDYGNELDMTDIVQSLERSIEQFRKSQIQKGEVSEELFGKERESGSVNGIIRDIFQSWDGEDVYPSIEEKAAHLLYFMVKNHPFIDGNKRCGAFAFVFFIQRTKIFDIERITSATLSIIALLIAESDPKNKDLMIQVVIHVVLTLLTKK